MIYVLIKRIILVCVLLFSLTDFALGAISLSHGPTCDSIFETRYDTDYGSTYCEKTVDFRHFFLLIFIVFQLYFFYPWKTWNKEKWSIGIKFLQIVSAVLLFIILGGLIFAIHYTFPTDPMGRPLGGPAIKAILGSTCFTFVAQILYNKYILGKKGGLSLKNHLMFFLPIAFICFFLCILVYNG